MIIKPELLSLREKPYKCVMCEKRFETQEELSRHQHLFCTGGW